MRRLLSCLVVLLLGMTVPAMAQITYHAPRDPGDGVSPFVGGGVDWSDVSSVIWYGPADRQVDYDRAEQ